MYGLELGQKCDLSWSPSEEKKPWVNQKVMQNCRCYVLDLIDTVE